jgi:hypothetical protein
MRTTVTAGLALLTLALVGCSPEPCMEDGFSRQAHGSADYVVSGRDGATVHGASRAAVVMHRFATFSEGECSLGDSTFSITLSLGATRAGALSDPAGSGCRLSAIASSREHDTGKHASLDFLQAEAGVIAHQSCSLQLEDGRWVRGRVSSGTFVIMPRTGRLALGLDVRDIDGKPAEGFMRVAMDVSWY